MMTNQEIVPNIKKTLTISLTLLSLAAVLFMAFLAWTPLMWIALAAFLAVAMNPIVKWFQKYMPKKSLGLATLIVLVLFVAACIALVWFFFVPLVQQTVRLIDALPELATKAKEALANTPLAETINTNISQIANSAGQASGALLGFIQGVVGAAVAFVTIIALMFFMTVEGKTAKETTLRLTPQSLRGDIQALGGKIYTIINGYVVGNFLLSALYGLTSGFLLWILGNPYYLVLGLIAALFDLIPLVGSTIAAIIIALVSLLTGQYWVAAIFVVFTIVYVQLENAVLNPMVYSKKVDISPLTVLVAVLIGAAIAGVLGTLLAIPVAATIKETAKVLIKRSSLAAKS